MVDKILVTKFRQELLEESRRHAERLELETAFVHWYVKTKFGGDCRYTITDGPNDGGIDAIVRLDGAGRRRVHVVQSKFSEEIFRNPNRNPSALSVSAYSDFDRLPDIFENEDEFRRYLESIESSLHDDYRRLFETIQQGNLGIVWELTTLQSRSRAGEKRLRNLDPSNFAYATDNLFLYELSLEGATPPAEPMTLNFEEQFTLVDPQMERKYSSKFTSHIASVKVKDFIDYLDADPRYQILARNVRSDLGSDINEDIKRTFATAPEEFWYSHNGITMICERANIKDKKITLDKPSVINGAQTLYALKGVRRRHPNALILVRIIVIPPGIPNAKDLINNIIFRTNQQNKMYRYDLRANDVLQIGLASEFQKRRVFYERRRWEWDKQRRYLRNQGFEYLNLVELAQILMACDQNLGGVAVAKRSREELFSDRYYGKLSGRTFQEMFFKYKLYNFILDSFYEIESKRIKPRQRRHALLTCLAVAWKCTEESRFAREWFSAVEQTPSKLSVNSRSAKDLQEAVKKLFRACWTRWRKENRRDKTLSPNNFFKSREWNEVLLRQFCPRFRREIQQSAQKAMA